MSVLSSAIKRVMSDPQVIEAMNRLGYDRQTTSPEEFGKLIKEQLAVWTSIIGASGKRDNN
jgi:tripartite-type tricarboxylate transporter receptor subunit TctC